MTGGAFGIRGVRIGRGVATDLGAVVSAVGVAGNAVPVKGSGVAKAAEGHGGAGHDLVASAYDGSFENPEELIGVTIRVTAGAGKSFGGGGTGSVEGDTSPFEM